MLEMMPGSIIDKTNNNLSNLVCAHSTIEQKTDLRKEKIMEVTETKVSVSCSELEANTSEIMSECNIVFQEKLDSIVSESNIYEETSACNDVSKTIECSTVSQETTECNTVAQETNECGIAAQENFESRCDIILKETSENIVITSTTDESHVVQETAETNISLNLPECNIVSETVNKGDDILQKSSNCNVAQKTTESDVVSEQTQVCSIVSEKTSECSIVSEKTNDYNMVSQDCNTSENLNLNCKIINENVVTNSTNSKNTVKNKKEKKLLSFLNKHKLTAKDLIPKIKYFKRQTKEKRKPNCVLSLKLNRYYFKSTKPKWSNRMSTNKKTQLVSTYLKNKKSEEQTTSEESRNESSSTSSLGENKNEENFIPDFKSDDDIRDKIKKQLELLRQNKKQAPKLVEEEPEVSKVEESREVTPNPEKSEPVLVNLEDVVLSKGDGELSIVSVVGGYLSDEDHPHEENDAEMAAEITEEIKEKPTQLIRGISMTDILLKRDFNTEISDSYIIKPTKTSDITKIKGWKTKHFAASIPETVETTLVEDTEKTEESVANKPPEGSLNTIENPIPGTSFGYCDIKSYYQPVKADNILKQGETEEKNTKSAFVSDMLDTYLINNAKLQISYEIPKLSAEEAITKPVSEMPVGNNDYLAVVNKSNYRKKTTNSKVFKPKTLAEKRRMLEQDRQNQLLHDMETNESIYLKQLEYCEKRNKNDVAKDIRENLMEKDAPFSRHCWNMATKLDEGARQFVIVNGNKIRILGSAGGDDIVVPEDKTRLSYKENYKSRFLNPFSQKIMYKPGPLSKKHKLIKHKNSNEKWEFRVLKMPKIKLIVHPEQGKRLPLVAEQYIQLYRGEKGFISDELAKFAVSAVRTQEPVKSKFEFDVPYNNGQNKLLVRKQIFQNTSHDRIKPEIKEIITPVIQKEFLNINVEDSIKSVMTEMLNCIENQDLDKEVIKDDPDLDNLNKNEKLVDRPPSPIDSRIQSIIKRPNKARSRSTLELRRLNVQVIEVDVKEDEENVEDICTKDFCKLGCVCKSLRGAASLVPKHCGKINCMLDCSCSFGNSSRGTHSITLPAGTDVLSASTVVRLQDEVKRNLAKEEKEFAQTVIKTNNQTIMVGGNVRERARRIPKVPKKYSNYVQRTKGLSYDKIISVGLLEDEDFEQQLSKAAIQKAKEDVKKVVEQPPILAVNIKKPVPIWIKKENKYNNIKDCRVNLIKLKLDHIAPWCMVHKLYKCHCDGKAVFETTPVKPKEGQITPEDNEYIAYAPRFQPRYVAENNSSVTVTDITDKYCARTRALATNFYQARNKSQSFKARYACLRKNATLNVPALRQERGKDEHIVNVTEYDDTNQINKRYFGEIDDDSNSSSQDLLVPRKNKKIKLVNVQDILHPQKKAESPKTPSGNPTHVVSAASFIDYDRSFMGLLTPSSEWLEKFHKMLNLNMNTVIRQIRLLEWATLVRRQKIGSLQLWFNSKKYNNIILTEDRKRPSRSHMNIKILENNSSSLKNFRLPEIITSLFQNKLPGVATKATETYVILVYNGISWEARGTIVLNDTSEMCRQRLGHKPTPVLILDPILRYKKDKTEDKLVNKPITSPGNPNIVIKSTPAVSVEVVNRNINKSLPDVSLSENRGLEITKIPCTKEKITEIVPQHLQQDTSSSKDCPILAPLPTGFGLNHWFMLILKSDFNVLRISFSNFHIKYTHLMTAIQTAMKNRKTVRIRSQDKNVDNPNNFGVYALPGFSDRIFFGPYVNQNDHGLETFRYINKKLVNTKIYNKMRGSAEKNTTGIWYYHSSTVQNNLLLEPQHDNVSSGSDCSTEMTNAEQAVKPQIEFVDLTENDSDNEAPEEPARVPPPQPNIDPIFNVLNADFSKKVSGDITIEPVYDNIPKTPIVIDKNDIVIQPINDDRAKLTSISTSESKENGYQAFRKRKSINNISEEPLEKQPTLIDSIELDDDDEPESFNDLNKQVPGLNPINTIQNLNNDALRKRSIIYVITNIPGIGYFEIFLTDKKCMRLDINGKATMFPTISMALTWLHQLFRKYIFFMPLKLKVKFSILESTDVPEMPKFNQLYLNGSHMMCEKGIFDLIRMTPEYMQTLGFTEYESSILLTQKCELLIDRNIQILGSYLVGPEEASKLDKEKILQIAPKKIKIMESRGAYLEEHKLKLRNIQARLLDKINSLIHYVPPPAQKSIRDKVYTILQQTGSPPKNSTALPAGKICKIVDGKIVVVDAIANKSPQTPYEMVVPITGLQTPVTVVGVPPSEPNTSLLLANNRNQSQRVVDLTDD